MECIECHKKIEKSDYKCKSCSSPICNECYIKTLIRGKNKYYLDYISWCDQCIWFDIG